MNFSGIVKAFDELTKISSTNEKMEWLRNHNDEDFKNVLKWYLDSSTITGIAEKKFDKVTNTIDYAKSGKETFDNVMIYLDSHRTGRDDDISYVKFLRDCICKTDREKEVFKALVCKNFPIGIQEKIVNKVFEGLIPTFDVMLANSYTKLNDSQKEKIFKSGKREFNVTTKLDGFRCIVYKKGNVVKLISRQGKLYEGCVDIEKAVSELEGDFVLDSEIIISNRKSLPSTLQYKATSNIVTLKNQEKHGITCNCFDYISMEEWESKKSKMKYTERRKKLETLLKDYADKDDKPLFLLPLLYVGTDIDEAFKLHASAKSNEEEGVMIRFSDSVYEFKRSNDLLKLKVFADMDVYIKGYEEGTNANKGRLGAFVCEIEHPTFGHLEMKVGSGYSENDRIDLWEMRDDLIGRVMEITYFEVTKSESTGISSVRFPVYKCIKDEGTKPNN